MELNFALCLSIVSQMGCVLAMHRRTFYSSHSNYKRKNEASRIIVLMVRWAMCGTSSIWSWAHFMLISCMYLYLLKMRRLYINADELFCYDMKEAESPFGFEEDQHRMHTKRQARLDPGVLLLLTTCEIWDECNVFFTVGKAKPMLIWRSLYAKVDYVLVIVLV